MLNRDQHKDYCDAVAIVEDELKRLQTRMLRDHVRGNPELRPIRNHVEKALERIRMAQRLLQYV